MDRTGEKILEEKDTKETSKHKDFTKYARKMTESYLIASIRDAGKVDMLAKGDCCDLLGALIDGMGK